MPLVLKRECPLRGKSVGILWLLCVVRSIVDCLREGVASENLEVVRELAVQRNGRSVVGRIGRACKLVHCVESRVDTSARENGLADLLRSGRTNTEGSGVLCGQNDRWGRRLMLVVRPSLTPCTY
jgi:hypothetical protein